MDCYVPLQVNHLISMMWFYSFIHVHVHVATSVVHYGSV